MQEPLSTRRRVRRVRWGRVFILLFVLFGLVTGAVGAGAYFFLNSMHRPALVQQEQEPVAESGHINILILGVDDGEYGNAAVTATRSDTIMVASIDPAAMTVNLLSIPRDTRVQIPGQKGLDKITNAHGYGGVDLSKRTVESFLGVPIQHYVEINWQAFIKVVDILGGVDLYVENNMNYDDPYADLHIHLAKGYQHLDGEKAGEYVRFRHDELGDIGRVQRQQRLIRALTDQMMQVGTILKLPSLASTLSTYVKTDMSTLDMLKVANVLRDLKKNSLYADMVPGDFRTIGGLSYWIVDQNQTAALVQRMFNTAGATSPITAKQASMGSSIDALRAG